jgi:hypothetical protein
MRVARARTQEQLRNTERDGGWKGGYMTYCTFFLSFCFDPTDGMLCLNALSLSPLVGRIARNQTVVVGRHSCRSSSPIAQQTQRHQWRMKKSPVLELLD